MFLVIVKDARTNQLKEHKLVDLDALVERHPYSMDLRGWAKGGRVGSRFGISNDSERLIYVRTDETDKSKLEALARSL